MNNIFKNLLLTAIFVILSIFTLAFIFSYRLASEVSKPIENLNSYINKFVESKFTIVTLIDEKKSNDEISILSNNFFKMSEEITNHIKFFEEKVKERTSEINKQNLEITNQKVKIHDQYKELFVKNLSLEKQQLLILEKNKDITDSILYAQRIQKAMMPSRAKLRNIVPNGFIFFQPRDIVSGDFYFTIEKDEKVFFGIADCTGHGVPGAFLSIIGNNALNKAINEFDLANPAEILNKVNDLVENSINNHDESVINDGMDIALCVLDKTRRILEYSGANIPLWIISEEEDVELELMDDNVSFATANKSQLLLKEFKPNKQPIGHYNYRQPFTNHIIHLKKNDKLYISSDGFADQFGGTKNKKFKNNQLRNLLLNIQFLNMDEQKQHIKEVIKNWKGANEQVDDITMLGIQV
jgi:serine phosphatase RsbU (regulator of sigma subunit)